MNELYTESLFHTAPEKANPLEAKQEAPKQEVLRRAGSYEFTNPFHFHLDKLEKEIFDLLGPVPLFQLEFETLRQLASSASHEKLYELLDRLEKFVDQKAEKKRERD